MKTIPRKWLQVLLLVCVLFASAPTVCRAQEQPPEPIRTNRPSVSQTPSLVPHKTVQLDVAAAHRLNKHAPDYWVTGGVSVRLPR